jgi:hypothetical protein
MRVPDTLVPHEKPFVTRSRLFRLGLGAVAAGYLVVELAILALPQTEYVLAKFSVGTRLIYARVDSGESRFYWVRAPQLICSPEAALRREEMHAVLLPIEPTVDGIAFGSWVGPALVYHDNAGQIPLVLGGAWGQPTAGGKPAFSTTITARTIKIPTGLIHVPALLMIPIFILRFVAWWSGKHRN